MYALITIHLPNLPNRWQRCNLCVRSLKQTTASQTVCEISQTNDSVANCVEMSQINDSVTNCVEISQTNDSVATCVWDLSNKRQGCNLCVRSLKQTTASQPVCEISQTIDSVANCVWDLSNKRQRRKLCGDLSNKWQRYNSAMSTKQTTALQDGCWFVGQSDCPLEYLSCQPWDRPFTISSTGQRRLHFT